MLQFMITIVTEVLHKSDSDSPALVVLAVSLVGTLAVAGSPYPQPVN